MKSVTKKRTDPPMRKEYDFSGGIVGKYAKRRADNANVVLLDTDVAGTFPDSRSVNDALRKLIKIAQAPKSRR